jgi:hypothetical protein
MSKHHLNCRIHGFSVDNEVKSIFNELKTNKKYQEYLNEDVALKVKNIFLNLIYNDCKVETKNSKSKEITVHKDILLAKLQEIISSQLKSLINIKQQVNNNNENCSDKKIVISNKNNYLKEFLSYKISSDFIIQLDLDKSKIFECHKMIFAAKSGYFYKLFKNHESISHIYINNINNSTFDFVFSYIYDLKIKLNPFNLSNLYIAAIIFEIEELKQTLIKFYQQNQDNFLLKQKIYKNIFFDDIFIKTTKNCKFNKNNNEFGDVVKIHICDEKCIE